MMPMGAVSIKVKAPALQELNLKGQGLGDAGGNLRHQLLYATVGRMFLISAQPHASITRLNAGWLRFFTLIQRGDRPPRQALSRCLEIG